MDEWQSVPLQCVSQYRERGDRRGEGETMRPFHYERVREVDQAIGLLAREPGAAVIAGATELLNWMKEGIAAPALVVDINALPLADIAVARDSIRIGALARLSDVAAHAEVRRELPSLARAIELAASPQLRNMGTMAGNLLQRTRCPYFRAEVPLPCNKRVAGSGCAALHGENRSHAIFGWSEHCVATHPSDPAVALLGLDARVVVRGAAGERTVPLADLHRLPGDQPQRETTLAHDELVLAIDVPLSPIARASRYLKVRERASYEFALVSAAAGVVLARERVTDARVVLGGVAHRPWRMMEAERALRGTALDRQHVRAAIDAELAQARPLEHNAFKVELARTIATRAVLQAGGVS
jgi:xanthine dehydrogenase YagS FAD-binding subunit